MILGFEIFQRSLRGRLNQCKSALIRKTSEMFLLLRCFVRYATLIITGRGWHFGHHRAAGPDQRGLRGRAQRARERGHGAHGDRQRQRPPARYFSRGTRGASCKFHLCVLSLSLSVVPIGLDFMTHLRLTASCFESFVNRPYSSVFFRFLPLQPGVLPVAGLGREASEGRGLQRGWRPRLEHR